MTHLLAFLDVAVKLDLFAQLTLEHFCAGMLEKPQRSIDAPPDGGRLLALVGRCFAIGQARMVVDLIARAVAESHLCNVARGSGMLSPTFECMSPQNLLARDVLCSSRTFVSE
jgi:hypothetical protein